MKKWLKLLSAALLFLPAAASAQWITDYSKNTQVTPVGLNYDENEVVTNDDGITYAFFIIQSNGTLGMRRYGIRFMGEQHTRGLQALRARRNKRRLL